MKNYTDTYFLNQRFNMLIHKSGPHGINRWKWVHELQDTKTNEILARYVGFSTGDGKIGGEPEFQKFWLQTDYCQDDHIYQGRFWQFEKNIRGSEK